MVSFKSRERAHRQNGSEVCGAASIRTTLDAQFSVLPSEKALVTLVGGSRFGSLPYEELRRRVRDNGIQPVSMADCFHDYLDEEVRVLVSRQGDLQKLGYLCGNGCVPIVHRRVKFPGMKKPEGHYSNFFGLRQDGRVELFDPSYGHGGFKYPTQERFMDEWLTSGERWFLVVLPSGLHLPRTLFAGKYL